MYAKLSWNRSYNIRAQSQGTDAMKAQMRRPPSDNPQSGFTLVELLVAMVIGLLVIIGATQLFTSSQQSYRVQTALANMQDTGRFAIDTLARELRQADYSGGCAPSQITVHLRNMADENDTPQAIQAWQDISNLDFSNSLLNPVANQGGLMFRGAPFARTGFTSESLEIASVDSHQQITLTNQLGDLFLNQLILLQGLQNCDIFYNTSSEAKVLEKSTLAEWQSNVEGNTRPWGEVSGLTYSADQQVSLGALSSALYYIGQDPANGVPTSLIRLDLSQIPQIPPRNEVVASHVIAMRTAFLIDDDYVPADEVSDAQWPDVQALRISLIVESDRTNLRSSDTTLSMGNFRGENSFTGSDGRLYQAFTTTVSLRNR